ncbi:MAG: hypothetical protein K8S25_15770 [Alphaproteobacteria bacterium]|nr:hypothetical protein [Alphaproteobacteria bacterium]
MAEEKRRRSWIFVVAGVASTAIAVLAFPAQVEQVYKWFAGKYDSWDAVELPGTYPGELWKVATSEQFGWLEDEWCYPTIPGFRSRFRVVDGALERQNAGQMPKPFTTEWWKTKVYQSNKGVLRIWYDDPDLPGNYISATPGKTSEWHEYERYSHDDGSVTSGKRRLVLSCKRCSLGNDGFTYSCN